MPRLRGDRPGRGRRASASTRGATSSAGGSTRGSTSRRRRTARTRARRREPTTLAAFKRATCGRGRGAGGRPPCGPLAARSQQRRRPVVTRLRLRQHHGEGGRAVARARAPVQLLRAVEGQSHRGRAVAVPAGARRGLRARRRARADRLRQGPAQGRPRRRRGASWRPSRTRPPRSTTSPTRT